MQVSPIPPQSIPFYVVEQTRRHADPKNPFSFAVAQDAGDQKDNPDLNAFCFCATNFVGYNDGVFDGASNITALVCDSLGDGWKQYLWEGDGFVHVRTNKKNNDDNSDNGNNNNNNNNSTDQKCVGNSVPIKMQPSIASNSQMIAAAWASREEVVVQRAKTDVRFRLREHTIRSHIPLKPAMGTSSVSAWKRTLIPERIIRTSLLRMQLLLSARTDNGTFTHGENTRRCMYVFLFINTTRERGRGRKRKTKKTVLTINVSV